MRWQVLSHAAGFPEVRKAGVADTHLPNHASSAHSAARNPIQRTPQTHSPPAPPVYDPPNTLLVYSSFTHLLLISSRPSYSAVFTFSLGLSCTNKVRRFNKLPCVSWALEQLQLCCGATRGFLAAAARQSHAAWSTAQDGGLITIKACFKVQFLPSTRAQSLGSLGTASHAWLPCTRPAQTAAFCLQNATETHTTLSHLTADGTEKWSPQLRSQHGIYQAKLTSLGQILHPRASKHHSALLWRSSAHLLPTAFSIPVSLKLS